MKKLSIVVGLLALACTQYARTASADEDRKPIVCLRMDSMENNIEQPIVPE